MEKFSVNVESDHLTQVANSKSPIASLCELIWNGLDADANLVKVEFSRNALGGLEAIEVMDNGTGITKSDLQNFKILGGSWKSATIKTRKQKRILHGKEGKGRFQAFGLGSVVEWETNFRSGKDIITYSIKGEAANLKSFSASDDIVNSSEETGTSVKIYNIKEKALRLDSQNSRLGILKMIAPYLKKYPSVEIYFDGNKLDPSEIEIDSRDFTLEDVNINGKNVNVSITITEWNTREGERDIYLCDEHGFTLEEIHPIIHAPGYSFSVYAKSPMFKELHDASQLQWTGGFASPLDNFVTALRLKVGSHFRSRTSEKAASLVEEWKKDEIYPYQGNPKNSIERAERQVFDVVSLNLSSFLPGFEKADKKSKRFQFFLLKKALEESPEELAKIIEDLVELPPEKQKELYDLLQKTTLSSVISAAKVVSDRLNFLRGLEMLLFDIKSKRSLLERKQLHKILADEMWIFGEEYHLAVNDQSLTEVLRAHIREMKRDSLEGIEEDRPAEMEEVLRSDGSRGIVDIMLSRSIPQPKATKKHHLVIELKRPSQKIDMSVLSQTAEYAAAISEDERFKDTDTIWTLWAVSNEMDATARRMCSQDNLPEGVFSTNPRFTIWSKTWAQIIADCKARLHFYQERLQYVADEESAIEYLDKTHSKYLLNNPLLNKSS